MLTKNNYLGRMSYRNKRDKDIYIKTKANFVSQRSALQDVLQQVIQDEKRRH